MLFPVWRRYQYFEISSDDFGDGVAEHPFGNRTYRLQLAALIWEFLW